MTLKELSKGYKKPGNPNFLNILKNTFNTEQHKVIIDARNMVKDILVEDIPMIIKRINIPNWICVCVPNEKAF